MNCLCYAASLVLVSAALVSAEFDVVKHEKCGGEFGEVRIDPCPELPCIVKKGAPLKLQVDFVAGRTVTIPDSPTSPLRMRGVVSSGIVIGGIGADSFKTLQMKLLGELSKGVWLPFPNFGRNACKKNGLTCPLESGKPYTLQSTLNVLSSFPTVNANVKWSMKGDNQTIFCFLVPVKVSD